MNLHRVSTESPRSGVRSRVRHALWIGAAACSALLGACGDEPAGPPPIPSTQVTAVDTPPPEYPIELACQDVGGKVVLSVTIGLDGKPSRIDVSQPHRATALNEAAQDAVRSWQFNPATRNGQPVETTIQVPMTFNPPSVRPQRCFALDDAG